MGKDNPIDKLKSKAESMDSRQKFIFPEYEVPNFSIGGTTTSYKDNTYGLTKDAQTQQEEAMVKQLRSELLSSLGINSGSKDDAYTNAYMNEILRISQPKLENALIGRGLGGSTVYKDSLTDLISKAGTQAILSGQQYKSNNLNALQNYLNGQNSLDQYLLGLQSPYIDKAYQKDLAQAMEDYRFATQPSLKEIAIGKMMSIFDPGGSYMGFYQNPTRESHPSAKGLSGLDEAMQLYSMWRSMSGGMGGGTTTAMPTTTDYSGLQALLDQYTDPYSNYYDQNYSALTGKRY